ncbi:hypothetical protein A1Q2_08146 [Trichosporon asahii var. asahii CBS 8904]|uniref:Uncharacterized protein n=1 Tax=Trichosporon asahii var. asahii (strain CBS 8904) TaxID=1220162 RepID=K1VEQ5_TRIAC|nr:hypothetical protein A1Q2_08146 [Trichosporon asahii var. asahii CBS 8904]
MNGVQLLGAVGAIQLLGAVGAILLQVPVAGATELDVADEHFATAVRGVAREVTDPVTVWLGFDVRKVDVISRADAKAELFGTVQKRRLSNGRRYDRQFPRRLGDCSEPKDAPLLLRSGQAHESALMSLCAAGVPRAYATR